MDIKEVINEVKQIEKNKILEILDKNQENNNELKNNYVEKDKYLKVVEENNNYKKEIKELNYRINILLRNYK